VLHRDVVDQLLDEHRLAQTRAAEQADLAAAHERRGEVDHLHAGLEDLELRRQLLELRRIAVDRPPLDACGCVLLVDGVADDVPQPAERRLADGDADRRARVDDVDTAGQTVRRVHGHRANAVVAECCRAPRSAAGGPSVVARHGMLRAL
jgi:hypothetical protein